MEASQSEKIPASSKRLSWLLLIGLAGLAVGIAIPSLSKPDLLWEWINVSMAQNIVETGIPSAPLMSPEGPLLIHPPTWAYIQAAALSWLGDGFASLRFPGLLVFLATGFTIWLLARRLGYGERAALLAALIYWTNAHALQGMVCLDFPDGSLLPFTTTLFLYVFVASRDSSLVRRSFLLALALSFAFISKFTTPMILTIAFLLVCLLSEREDENWKLFVSTVAVTMVVVVGLWALYCMYLSSRMPGNETTASLMRFPIDYMQSKAAAKAWELPLTAAIINPIRFVVYAGPFLFIFAFPDFFQWIRRSVQSWRLPEGSIVPLFTLGVLSAYCLFVGGGGPFRKYFQPALPTLALLSARFLSQSIYLITPRKIGYFFAAGCGLLAYYLWIGDLVAPFNNGLREAIYLGDTSGLMQELLGKAALYSLPVLLVPIALMALKRSEVIRPWFATTLVASQVAFGFYLSFSEHSVRYLYGVPYADVTEVTNIVRKAGGSSLADPVFQFAAGVNAVSWADGRSWSSPETISTTIQQEEPHSIVYGLPTHTISDFRSIEQSVELQALLHAKYELYSVGDFKVWVSRSVDQPSAVSSPPPYFFFPKENDGRIHQGLNQTPTEFHLEPIGDDSELTIPLRDPV